jgi:uncharacterized caspase-like protein
MLHAAIFGIDRYADEKIRDLEFARADAEAVAAALSRGVAAERQLSLLVDERATKARIKRVITEELPRQIEPGDSVLLYFAGHGSPEVDGADAAPSVHIVVHDTTYTQLYATSINVASELAAWMRRLPARVVLVVLDASFNGAGGGRTFEGPGLWSGPRLRRLERLSLAGLSLGGQGAMLTACGEKEVAREDRELRHGVFTHHFLETLRSDLRVGSPVTVAALHRQVSGRVRDATLGRQGPVLYGRAGDESLFRLRASRPQEATP